MKVLKMALFAVLCAGMFACSTESAEKAPTSLVKDKIAGNVKQINAVQYALSVSEDGTVFIDSLSVDNIAETVFVYNKDGNVGTSELRDYYGNLIGSQTFKYDRRNNPVEIEVYNAFFHARMKQLFKYDDKNRILEMKFIDNNGKTEAKETSVYDDALSTQTVTYSDSAGNVLSMYVNLLDSSGNVLDNKWMKDSTAKSHHSAVFDEYGNRTEVLLYDAEDNVENRFVSSYDEHGNLLVQVGYDKSGEEISRFVYKYEFDTTGNWTSCEEWQEKDGNITPVSVIRRKIEYWD